MKKLLAIILLSATLFTACSTPNTDSPDANPADTTAETTISEAADDNEPAVDDDDLPAMDYNGYNFRIYSRDTDWFHGNIIVAEYNGDVLNDAIFDRNLKIAQRFNVEFTEETGTDTNAPRNAILAGEDAYNIVNARCTAALTLAEEHLTISIDMLPYIDLDKNYWNTAMTNELAVGDKVYLPVGDMNLTFMDYACIMLFNKKMHTDFQLDDPYTLVRDGNWTFDTYLNMALAVTDDLNGDGAMTDADRYGTLGGAVFAGYSLIMSTGVKSINKNSANEPVFEITTDTKFIEMWTTVLDTLYNGSQWFDTGTSGQADPVMNNFFKSDQALFYSTTFYEIEAMRDMDTDFGIIPQPKFNESQPDYYTRVSFFDMITIPVTVTDLDMVSIIIEALTCESGKTVFPAYYDVAVSTKATRDDESIEMLELIKNSRVLDLGDTIWSDQIRNGYLINLIKNRDSNITSASESRSTSIQALLDKSIELFKGN